ncbi:tRNA (adenosine(37)-N6)-dimethylallyltransferase MiaA [Candidatus Gracilibacteria bacterium]|nr:tRNA (adenosine(37)-N6)-dimethylallyltransferase MiaA [Candidatus Gracilibacteria bacterium]
MQDSIRNLLDIFLKKETELPKIIVIYGPTACGKTALSIEVAQYIQSEIISTDSRQIYRNMNIGTGKITPEETQGIPHHMIDIIDPSKVFSVVDFTKMALPIIDRIQKDGKIPILCGGTGLYIDGILFEMAYPDTPPNWEYREELETIRIEKGNQELWNMLERVDPEYARTLEVDNYRYIMRGLEVMKETGRSKIESIGKKIPRFSPLFITPYSDTNRQKLYDTIDLRVSEMFNTGLISEIEYIIEVFTSTCPGLTTIGYREIVDALEGKTTLEAAKSLIQQRSRNYAKRQITWNKRYEPTN